MNLTVLETSRAPVRTLTTTEHVPFLTARTDVPDTRHTDRDDDVTA